MGLGDGRSAAWLGGWVDRESQLRSVGLCRPDDFAKTFQSQNVNVN